MIKSLLFVALGGAFGSSLRFLMSESIYFMLGRGFPFATLTVNILGSFLMGVLYALIEHELVELAPWRTFVGVGFLGALTTFSTFSMDTLLLLQQGDWLKAVVNVFLNVFVCIFVAWLGMNLINIKG